jgi:hypothetical protein
VDPENRGAERASQGTPKIAIFRSFQVSEKPRKINDLHCFRVEKGPFFTLKSAIQGIPAESGWFGP